MTAPVAGIDPHQNTFTVGIVDHNGVELATATFQNRGSGYVQAADLFATHRVQRVGVEGTASWGQHVAIALVAAGLDVREVPAQRSARQRRARRLAKTDVIDATATARALLAEPTLGPAQALEIYDPLVAEIEAVLEHRRALVEARTLMLHHAQDRLAKLPTEIRDQIPAAGKIETRLRKLETIDTSVLSSAAGAYRLGWLIPLIAQDRTARRQIRQPVAHPEAEGQRARLVDQLEELSVQTIARRLADGASALTDTACELISHLASIGRLGRIDPRQLADALSRDDVTAHSARHDLATPHGQAQHDTVGLDTAP